MNFFLVRINRFKNNREIFLGETSNQASQREHRKLKTRVPKLPLSLDKECLLYSSGRVPPDSPFPSIFGAMVKSHFGAPVLTLWTSSPQTSPIAVVLKHCSPNSKSLGNTESKSSNCITTFYLFFIFKYDSVCQSKSISKVQIITHFPGLK